MTLADEMKRLRLERGLSRERLATAAGLSSSTVERIELKGHVPKLDALAALAKALDVPVGDLIDAVRAGAAA